MIPICGLYNEIDGADTVNGRQGGEMRSAARRSRGCRWKIDPDAILGVVRMTERLTARVTVHRGQSGAVAARV
jgi:hypothetical protein